VREDLIPEDVFLKILPIYLFAVTGVLKGYDQLLNLVLDEVQEEVQGA
jgi:hypothetical protein